MSKKTFQYVYKVSKPLEQIKFYFKFREFSNFICFFKVLNFLIDSS
jgi:hypothetical protein